MLLHGSVDINPAEGLLWQVLGHALPTPRQTQSVTYAKHGSLCEPGRQMETLLYSSLTTAHLEREASLGIRCIPDMPKVPSSSFEKPLLDPAVPSSYDPVLSSFSLPNFLNEKWSHSSSHFLNPHPPALLLPPCALLKPSRGHRWTTHFQCQWHFLHLHPPWLSPKHWMGLITVWFSLNSVTLSYVGHMFL
jgi:hypothetical protein